jgi:Tfp pilus assembly protein PilN
MDRRAVYSLSIRKSLGLYIQGETLQLALLSRQPRSVRLLELLSIPGFRQRPVPELRNEISGFLRRNQAVHVHCVMVIPREEVIVRQLDLPTQAEANLAKVVEYQSAMLVPSESAAICYDFCASKQTPQSKSLQVTVFLVMKSWVDQAVQLVESLGLRVDLVLPSSIAIVNYVLLFNKRFKAETALVASWHDTQCEVVGVLKSAFHHSREIRVSESDDVAEVLQTEAEFFRGRANLLDETPLDLFVLGNPVRSSVASSEKRFKIHRFSLPRDFGIELGNRALKISDIQDQFLAVAGGFCGLRRKNPVAVNLLPVEKRVRKSKWTWAPTYALLGANLLLLVSLIVRKPIQDEGHAAELSQEVSRLEPEVRRIRSVENESADLQRRTQLLVEYKRSNRRILEALNELSKILPKNAWVSDFNIRNQGVELYGASEAAAALPQILDNSPYFKETEFIAPILKDGQGNEVYRIRMNLEQPGPLTITPAQPLVSEVQTSGKGLATPK